MCILKYLSDQNVDKVFTLKIIVLNVLKYITFYHYRSIIIMMLKSLRVKILEICEDSRMSSVCEMWRVGIFLKREDFVNVLIVKIF